MLLRRVIAHFRKQEWTAIAIDLVIVVLGVFIGIQVANWNDERTARAQLDQQLVALRIELEGNRSYLAEYRAELEARMNDVAILREAFKSSTPSIDTDEINARFLNIQRVSTFSPDLTALDDLRDTGGLRRLSGTQIRSAIADWERGLANVNRLYADALRQRDGVLNPYMMEHIAYGPLLEQSYIVGEGIGYSQFRNDFRTLARSRELDNNLAYRYGIEGSTVHFVELLQSETAQLIDALKAREEGRSPANDAAAGPS